MGFDKCQIEIDNFILSGNQIGATASALLASEPCVKKLVLHDLQVFKGIDKNLNFHKCEASVIFSSHFHEDFSTDEFDHEKEFKSLTLQKNKGVPE